MIVRPNFTPWLLLLGVVVIAAASVRAGAEEAAPDTRPSIEFSAAAEREVPNDLMRVRLAVESEDVNPAALAAKINSSMRWALDRARGAKAIAARSGGYQSFPVYEKSELLRWRASQDLLLESRDTDTLSALVGDLQAQLVVKSVTLTVSAERRRDVENELIDVALNRFKARAEIIRRNLDAETYSLGRVSVQTQDAPVSPLGAGGLRMQKASLVVEPGTSTIVVRVSGSIRIP